VAAELLGVSADDRAFDALVSGLDHPSARVRGAVIEGLARKGGAPAAHRLAGRLAEEPDAELRLELARALRSIGIRGLPVADAMERGARDADPRVAAICEAERLVTELEGEALGAALRPMLEGDDPAARDAALWALTRGAAAADGVPAALRRLLGHARAEVRIRAARAVLQLGLTGLLPELIELLRKPRTGPAVARLVVEIGDASFASAEGAHSTVASLTQWAERASRRPRGRGNALLSRLLRGSDPELRRHATAALSAKVRRGGRAPLPTHVVEPLLDRRVKHAYLLCSLLAGLARDDGVPDWEVEEEFAVLAREVELRVETARREVLDLLLLLGRQRLVSAVEVGRRRPTRSRDAAIAELLGEALPPRLARRVVPLFERLSLRERVRVADRLGLVSERAIDDPLATIVDLSDPLLLWIARRTYGARFDERFGELAGEEDEDVVPRFERLRFLRSIPMFSELGGEDLLSVADSVEEVEKEAGETIFDKGDPGEDLYLIVEGAVDIVDGEACLGTLSEREFFGDLAVLDHQPRSAGAVARTAVRLMRLRGADLEELMEERPQITREILTVLAQRLRRAGGARR